MSELMPFRLHPALVERTWGRRDLRPWYSKLQSDEDANEPVGEAWLTGPQCVVNDGVYQGRTLADVASGDGAALLGDMASEAEFPLLIKLLFPDAKLSVQVHPNDEEARARGLGRGKTECWYVLAAEPGATVACGLRPGVTAEHMSAAIADGTAESLMEFLPVSVGDMVFVDAGTVHAIGPGVTLLEIQQTSDTTYRLYDYGRPRELHVEQGLAVTKTDTRAGKVPATAVTVDGREGKRLIQEQYFTVDSFTLEPGDTMSLPEAGGKPYCLTAIHGDAEVAVASVMTAQMPASSSVVVPAGSEVVTVRALSRVEVVRSTP